MVSPNMAGQQKGRMDLCHHSTRGGGVQMKASFHGFYMGSELTSFSLLHKHFTH